MEIGGDGHMEQKYYITDNVCISRDGLIKILRNGLVRGDSLFWISTFHVKDGATIIHTVDNLMCRFTLEDLLSGLRSLVDIFTKAIIDDELDADLLDAESVDLAMQVGFFGTLVYD